jgi:hypothetical protein
VSGSVKKLCLRIGAVFAAWEELWRIKRQRIMIMNKFIKAICCERDDTDATATLFRSRAGGKYE